MSYLSFINQKTSSGLKLLELLAEIGIPESSEQAEVVLVKPWELIGGDEGEGERREYFGSDFGFSHPS